MNHEPMPAQGPVDVNVIRQTCGYGVTVGQIYIAADGSKCGHLVTDTTTYAYCDDVVTTPFIRDEWKEPGNRIDAFKLAMVRYTLSDTRPEWMPANAGSNGPSAERIEK